VTHSFQNLFFFFEARSAKKDKNKKLVGSTPRVEEHFCSEIRKMRSGLIPHSKDTKSSGCRTFMKIEKLVVNGRVVS
jgi:hypothetical protein